MKSDAIEEIRRTAPERLDDLELEAVAGGLAKVGKAVPIVWPILFPTRIRRTQ